MITAIDETLVRIPADSILMEGALTLPRGACALVAFAHGSGSSRHSPRNKFVASVLHKAGIGSLLFDLLSEEEDTLYENRFNIGLLARRLRTATAWIGSQPSTEGCALGYFGASTGAAAALQAAAEEGPDIRAVVSRGGRPDLAMEFLGRVQSPTLLIVGGLDYPVIRMNEEAFKRIKAEKELKIVSGASHLFEEPGTLEEVARLATEWFRQYLLPLRT